MSKRFFGGSKKRFPKGKNGSKNRFFEAKTRQKRREIRDWGENLHKIEWIGRIVICASLPSATRILSYDVDGRIPVHGAVLKPYFRLGNLSSPANYPLPPTLFTLLRKKNYCASAIFLFHALRYRVLPPIAVQAVKDDCRKPPSRFIGTSSLLCETRGEDLAFQVYIVFVMKLLY